jgi:hypothetical protein
MRVGPIGLTTGSPRRIAMNRFGDRDRSFSVIAMDELPSDVAGARQRR